jgi:LPS-assembly lipoprotein
MSSSDKPFIGFLALLAMVACLAITGCGFTPLYAKAEHQDAQVAAGFDQVGIGNIPDQKGQYLRNALIDRFYQNGRPDMPRYHLELTPIAESQTDLDITRSATTTRTQLRLTTTMTLTDTKTGKVLLTRDLFSVNSYNILETQYNTNVSQEYVRENLLDDLARQIEAQLALYFKRQ